MHPVVSEHFGFLATEFGFTLTRCSAERVTFAGPPAATGLVARLFRLRSMGPGLQIDLLEHGGKLEVMISRSGPDERPLGNVLLREVVEILGGEVAPAAESPQMTDGEEAAHQAELLRRYGAPFLRGDFSQWEFLQQTRHRRFVGEYHRVVRAALQSVIEEFALREEEGPEPGIILFRSERVSLRVMLDGSYLQFAVAPGKPGWAEGEWFELIDFIWFSQGQLAYRPPCYRDVFRYDAIGYVHKQLEVVVPLLREYCADMLGGDFGRLPEIREFRSDPWTYARHHGWYIDPTLFNPRSLLRS